MSHLLLFTHWNQAREDLEEWLAEQYAEIAWLRSHLLLRSFNGVAKYAVTVLSPDNYKGSDQAQPTQQQRNVNGTFVQVMSPVIKRDWMGIILLDKLATGQVGYEEAGGATIYYQFPTRDELLAVLRQSDLEVKSFEDPDWWDALWDYRWSPEMAFQGDARMTRMQTKLVKI